MARERRRLAPRQRPRRRRVPAGEPLLRGAAPCASCAVRVLRTEQRDGQVYVFRDPGDAGCQRVSHFCGALRRARPAPCASCARSSAMASYMCSDGAHMPGRWAAVGRYSNNLALVSVPCRRGQQPRGVHGARRARNAHRAGPRSSNNRNVHAHAAL